MAVAVPVPGGGGRTGGGVSAAGAGRGGRGWPPDQPQHQVIRAAQVLRARQPSHRRLHALVLLTSPVGINLEFEISKPEYLDTTHYQVSAHPHLDMIVHLEEDGAG